MPDLLMTKLYIPRRRQNAVSRPRLIEALKAGTDRKLTLISAPAGFGKTTLLSEWIPQSDQCVTWVSLDSEDNDPVRFWAYVIAALQMLDPEIGKHALSLLQMPQPPPIETVLTILLNEITDFPDPFVHVLDDYQVIQTPAIHSAISFFLEHMPPNLHLVISSRTDPPFPLGRLRSLQLLNELRSDDLRFTYDETTVFLNQLMGLNLSAENVTSLETHTEGWIAGLQLAALALRGRHPSPADPPNASAFIQAFTGSHKYIVSYLVEEVLSQQSQETIDFLQQTSILDRLNGPLCDHILHQPANQVQEASTSFHDSQVMLEKLVHANLFVIPLDEEGQWYRYHHLFADVLRARLQKAQPDRIRANHLRASEWYEQAGLINEAVSHAFDAEAWEHAAQLIEQNALVYGFKGQIHLVLSWLTALPETIVRSHPLLCIFFAGALMHSSRLNEAEARLEDAERAIQPDAPADLVRLNLGRVSMHRSNLFRIQGDIEGSVEHARRALDLLPETEIPSRATAHLNMAYGFLVSGDVNSDKEVSVTAAITGVRAIRNTVGVLRGTALLARLRTLQGRLRHSEELYQEVSTTIPGQDEAELFVGTPTYFFGLGDLKREWNLLEESEKLLAQGILQARRQAFDGDVILQGYQSLARVKLAQGDSEGTRETIAEFIQLAKQYHFSDALLANAHAFLAWLGLMTEHLLETARWAETVGIKPDDEIHFPREREYLTLARLLIRMGRDNPKEDQAQQALQLLYRLQAAAQADGRLGSLIEILCLQALAFKAAGSQDQAWKTIDHALTLAGPEGYIRMFVDEGESMRVLLAEANSRVEKQTNKSGWLSSYLDQILAAFPVDDPGTQPWQNKQTILSDSPDLLSERELEVLRLIANGASNAEIAKTLIIALSTVKRHTVNLYNKLGVNSRTQAIARAQQLHLLS